MKTRENIIIIERVMQKTVPVNEVKVTITLTELCRFIQAARDDEVRKSTNTKGQYSDLMDAFNRTKGPSRKKDIFGDIFK